MQHSWIAALAALPLLVSAAAPPERPDIGSKQQSRSSDSSTAPVVTVNFLERLLQDGKPRRRASSQRQRKPRQQARPPAAAGALGAAAAVPALAGVPVPTPRPASADSAVETPPETAAETPPAAQEATGSTSTPGTVPGTGSEAPTVEQPGTATEAPSVSEVPKPTPKPVEEAPAQDSGNPAGNQKDDAKPSGDAKEADTGQPEDKSPEDKGKAEDKATEEDKASEDAKSPPPPPLEKEDPEALKACLADLTALGTKFEIKQTIVGDEPGCGIDRPIAVEEILPGVKTGGAEMRCETAHALAHWMKDNVQPALNVAMPGRRVTTIIPGSTYACRLRNSASSGKVSEHARGNAIDVAAFKLDNGETVTMKPRGEDSTLEGAFQRTASASACLYFSTVLSPGSDSTHEDHLHLDVLDRKNGYRYCR